MSRLQYTIYTLISTSIWNPIFIQRKPRLRDCASDLYNASKFRRSFLPQCGKPLIEACSHTLNMVNAMLDIQEHKIYWIFSEGVSKLMLEHHYQFYTVPVWLQLLCGLRNQILKWSGMHVSGNGYRSWYLWISGEFRVSYSGYHYPGKDKVNSRNLFVGMFSHLWD